MMAGLPGRAWIYGDKRPRLAQLRITGNHIAGQQQPYFWARVNTASS